MQLLQLFAQPFQFAPGILQTLFPAWRREVAQFKMDDPLMKTSILGCQHVRDMALELISGLRQVSFPPTPLLSYYPEGTHGATEILGSFAEFAL